MILSHDIKPWLFFCIMDNHQDLDEITETSNHIKIWYNLKGDKNVYKRKIRRTWI